MFPVLDLANHETPEKINLNHYFLPDSIYPILRKRDSFSPYSLISEEYSDFNDPTLEWDNKDNNKHTELDETNVIFYNYLPKSRQKNPTKDVKKAIS